MFYMLTIDISMSSITLMFLPGRGVMSQSPILIAVML